MDNEGHITEFTKSPVAFSEDSNSTINKESTDVEQPKPPIFGVKFAPASGGTFGGVPIGANTTGKAPT